jgi:hypothetical protein
MLLAGVLVGIAALVPAFVNRSPAVRPIDLLHGDPPGAPAAIVHVTPGATATPGGDHGRRFGAADGVVPDGTTVFDDEVPGVANLDPTLLAALRQAAGDASDHGITFLVESGWRSAAYQEQLLREAISRYGSEAEAARWVATPETSPHVSGDAVDIGRSGATTWLSRHGHEYGLCQIYRNEPWHFELRPSAIDHGCPRMFADPTHDPRMQP